MSQLFSALKLNDFCEKISVLQILNIYYHIHNSLKLDPILGCITQTHIVKTKFFYDAI
jgi:hypothetical protein